MSLLLAGGTFILGVLVGVVLVKWQVEILEMERDIRRFQEDDHRMLDEAEIRMKTTQRDRGHA